MLFLLHLQSLRCYIFTVWIQFVGMLTHGIDMQINCAKVRRANLGEGGNFITYRRQTTKIFSGPSSPLSLFHSTPSITQTLHEYKWRAVRSMDLVAVNGLFPLGLRQQCSSNGFSLTGFNHVLWYPLKRMQIVNQLAFLPILRPPSSSRSQWSSSRHSPCTTFPHLVAFRTFNLASRVLC